jgi:hypothetical protein
MLGYRPSEGARGYLEGLARKQPKEPRWRRGLALLDERKSASRSAFLRGFLPTLTDDAFGLAYVERIGRTGAGEDAAPLVEAAGKVEAVRLKLAMVAAAMRLGDASVAPEAVEWVRKTRSAEARIPVDTALVFVPAFADKASERLAKVLDDPRVNLRWKVFEEMAVSARPGGWSDAAQAVVLKGLADADPWVRLGSLGVAWRLRPGDGQLPAGVSAAARKLAEADPERFLRDAATELVAR